MESASFTPLTVFVHIVTFNDEESVRTCLESLVTQGGFEVGQSLEIHVLDNASSDRSAEIARAFSSKVSVQLSPENLGFCGGHNVGVSKFLESSAEYLVILNPDTKLPPNALSTIVTRFSERRREDPSIGAATPKLLRFSSDSGKTVDSAGIVFLRSFRHLDRGAGEADRGQYEVEEMVAGGTGACLCLHRECVESLILPYQEHSALVRIYPQLADTRARTQLFDEAFFAYREDADLAMRASLFGWKTLYVPSSVVYHARRVTPERRGELPSLINFLGVRNRFLLQVNNYFPSLFSGVFLRGIVLRNVMVVCAVLVWEQQSLRAFSDLWVLFRRARANRRYILRRSRELCGRSVENVFS